MAEFAVSVPDGAGPGSLLQITSPDGATSSLVTVPSDGAAGQEIRCVQAKNQGLTAGAFTGGGARGLLIAGNNTGININRAVGNAIGLKAKKTGEGVFIPCDKCGVNNETKMTMSSGAQFECGACGATVRWRPRQIWLRDMGRPLEKSVHLKEGEAESSCCVLS
mmetsp:Transcript_100061/g.312836  ORF Transcript_100061/g.312836 Transcript_100061/m.312836 type:complete len:164 (-) Transcript_100061:112-603(-)